MEDQHDPHQFLLGIADGGGAVVNGVLRAVARNQYRVVRQTDHLPLAQHFSDRVVYRLPGLFVDDVEHLNEGTLLRLLQRPSGQAFRHRVHEGHASLRVGGDHGVADAGKGRGEPFPAGDQIGLRLFAGDAERDLVGDGSHGLLHGGTEGMAREQRGHADQFDPRPAGAFPRRRPCLRASPTPDRPRGDRPRRHWSDGASVPAR